MTSGHRRGLIEVGLASLCFGTIGLFGKAAFQVGLDVGQLLTFRFLIAGFLLGAFLLLTRRQDLWLSRRSFGLSILLGVFGYAVFASLYFLAVQGLSIALAAMLLYTYPFWTVLFNAGLGERLRREQWWGLGGAGLGLSLLLWGQLEVHSATAVLAGIASALTYALFVIVSGRTLRHSSSSGSGFWIIASATLGLYLIHQPDLSAAESWSVSTWGIICAIALIGTVIPLVLIQAGLQKLSSTETATLSMLEPVTAALVGMIWLHETLSLRQFAGAALVLISLWVTQKPRLPRIPPPSP